MADKKDMQREIAKLTQASTNMMLQNVLKKHNVKLSGENFSKEEKAQLKKLVADFRKSFQNLETLQNEEKK